jgi:general secretion pathway protein E
MLIARAAIGSADLDKARQIQQTAGGNLGALLVRIGAVSEDVLLETQAERLGVAYLRDSDELPDHLAAYRLMAESPERLDWFLNNHSLVWRDGERLCCIARDVEERTLLETLDYFFRSEPVTFYLAPNHHLDRLLEAVRKERAMESLFAGDDARQLRELAEEAPIIALVSNLLAQAVDLEASDIHVEPGEEQFTVRMRVDGVLHTRLTQPIERFAAVASRIKLISGIDIAERRLPQDGRITERIAGKDMDIRVSTVPCAGGESIVLRLLAQERGDMALANLGMESDHLAMFRGWLHASNGIVLVTGPTGSGKSTTLAGALEEMDDGEKKIITVEDPVEYQMPRITQIQVHAEIGNTFARALRHIVRQDPDVIMVGEIRDLETAEIAIRAALTGHVVLSTVHTNDAVSSFTRLTDMGVEPFLVAAPMRGVQAQRLVRKVCARCAEPAPTPGMAEDLLAGVPSHLLGGEWVETKGCDACQHTGFRGRMGIYELVPMGDELQNMIVAGDNLNDLKRFAHRHEGHRTLLQDGLIKASHGRTTVAEVMRLTLNDGEGGLG